jgi:CRP-like cAMP-binding protein
MTRVDRSAIAGLKTFAGWSPADLDALLEPARSMWFPKGSNVFEQNAPASSFYLLLDGHVQAIKLTPDGQQVIIRYVQPGELFGIAAQIRQKAYPATAKAIVDSVALAWPSAAWPKLAEKFPALSASVLQAVGSRLAEANTRVMEMSTEAVERRVAHALLRLAKRSGREVEGGVEIAFPVTRQDLAEMTGTTLFTVSRILRAWQDDGLVASARRRIVVRDVGRLSSLAEGARGA